MSVIELSSHTRDLSRSSIRSFVRSFVRNWKRRKKAEIPAHTCTQEHREEERGSFKFFRKMNAPGSRRVKLQKFRTLYSPHDERGSDLFIYTTKKPVAYKRTSPPSPSPPTSLSPLEPPAYFHRRAPTTISFSLFSFHSSTRSDAFARTCEFNRLLYIYIYILKVNRSMHDARCTMFSHLSRVKKIKNKKEKISLKFYLSHHPAERS